MTLEVRWGCCGGFGHHMAACPDARPCCKILGEGAKACERSGWVCPPGMGHVALVLAGTDIRRLAHLPMDVEIVRALPHFERRPPAEYEREWTYQPPWDEPRPIYLHVKHRYFVRIALGRVLMVMKLDELLEHYNTLKAAEEASHD